MHALRLALTEVLAPDDREVVPVEERIEGRDVDLSFVHFTDDRADGIESVAEPEEHFDFASLDIQLEQIDAIESVFVEQLVQAPAGNGFDTGRPGLRMHGVLRPVFRQREFDGTFAVSQRGTDQ